MSDCPIVRRLLTLPRDRESRTAFSSASGKLDFAALRETMLGVAGWLVHEAGVQPGDRVALCLPKSLEAIQAVYGILAAGAAYVGLQFRGPPARLGTIVASAAPRLLLTTSEMVQRLGAEGGLDPFPRVLHVDSASDGRGLDALLRSVRPLATTVPVGPDDLGAIVFTSGSTGEPKGVMLSHRNIAYDVNWMVDADEMGPDDLRLSQVPLQYISPHLFQPAVAGSRVHLLTDEENMFAEHVAEAMEREGATVWAAASTALRLLVEGGELERRNFSRLRLVKSHGEPLPIPVLRRAMAALPHARFSMTYGSTEAPDITHCIVPRPLPEGLDALPLGTTQPAYELRLCDEAGADVPAGQIGEICAIGPGVTPGYWRDPALTATKRLDGRRDSFRTGDLGFQSEAGSLHFVGRKSQLVKLRGHRFDLGEIEAALKRHPAVREAVVLAGPDEFDPTDIRVAVESAAPEGLERALMQICSERLPRFAWPTRLIICAELPRLPSGKIDRRKLAADSVAI